jgi:hypothetical protein
MGAGSLLRLMENRTDIMSRSGWHFLPSIDPSPDSLATVVINLRFKLFCTTCKTQCQTYSQFLFSPPSTLEGIQKG